MDPHPHNNAYKFHLTCITKYRSTTTKLEHYLNSKILDGSFITLKKFGSRNSIYYNARYTEFIFIVVRMGVQIYLVQLLRDWSIVLKFDDTKM